MFLRLLRAFWLKETGCVAVDKFEAASKVAENINRLTADFRSKKNLKRSNYDPKNL